MIPGPTNIEEATAMTQTNALRTAIHETVMQGLGEASYGAWDAKHGACEFDATKQAAVGERIVDRIMLDIEQAAKR